MAGSVIEIGGLPIPDDGPAASAAERRGRRVRAGRLYVSGRAVLLTSLSVLSIRRRPATAHLLVISGVHGGFFRPPTPWHRRPPVHVPGRRPAVAIGVAGLPHVLHWTLPALVGAPLLVRTATALPPITCRW